MPIVLRNEYGFRSREVDLLGLRVPTIVCQAPWVDRIAPPRTPSFKNLHLYAGDDAKDAVGLQRRTTDERPIDIGLAQQFRGVIRLDATPVLDSH